MAKLPPPPPISVCIPARNEENTITTTMYAVLSQLVNLEAEVLICINGCTDKTEQIVREISASDKRVRVLLSPPGKSAAWNVLFSTAMFDDLIFLDADIIPLNGSIHTLVSFMNERNLTAATPLMKKIIRPNSFWARLWHYPPELPTEAGIQGGMYALKKKNFSQTLQRRGYAGLPLDLINEDHWIQLILENRSENELVAKQYGYCKDACVLYQPASLFDFYKQSKRIIKGDILIERRYPDLGFSRSYKKEMLEGPHHTRGLKERIARKLGLLKQMEFPSDRFLMPFVSLWRQLAIKTLYTLARWRARSDFKNKIDDWGYAGSSKQHIEPDILQAQISKDTPSTEGNVPVMKATKGVPPTKKSQSTSRLPIEKRE